MATLHSGLGNHPNHSNNQAERTKCILFLGLGRVGKTSLIKRFLEQQFTAKYRPTVEDIFHRDFEINDRPVSLEFMDTSGSYDFPAMRKICIAKAAAFVLVFSLQEIDSLAALAPILDQIREERADFDQLPLVVAGNKLDLVEGGGSGGGGGGGKSRLQDNEEKSPPVSQEDGEAWMSANGLAPDCLILTSAKEEDGVWQLFTRLWELHRDLLIVNSTGGSTAEGLDQLGPDLHAALPPPRGAQFAQMLEKRRFSAFAVLTGAQAFNPKSLGDPNGSSGLPMAKSPRRKRNSRPSIFKAANGRSKKEPMRVDCVIS